MGSVEVQIEGEGAAPITVVERAIQIRNERIREAKKARKKGNRWIVPFDEVWCVFDVERLVDNPSFYPAVKKARASGFQLAISNPAFEYWYLLHFKETTRPFRDASALLRALKQTDCLPQYGKSEDVFYDLLPKMDIAIKRASRIFENHPDKRTEFPNPSTLVFKLVLKLKQMADT